MRNVVLWAAVVLLSACGPSELEPGSQAPVTQEDISVVQSALSNPIGYHDAIDSTNTWGWACDPDNYSQPVAIHFYKENNVFIGATTANLGREPAVGTMCGGNPYHGFSWAIPDSLKDGYQHYIYAWAIDLNGVANPLLGNSPKLFGPVGSPVATSSCGSSCQSGWHSTGISCSFSCGSCSTYGVTNTVSCAPNSAKFSQCGTGCPQNWHSSSISCSSACGVGCGTYGNVNSAYCEYNQGSFSQCGTGCPSGWHPTSISCSDACGVGCANYGNVNSAYCVPNAGSFSQCGTSCPAGWRVQSTSCSSACGVGCGTYGNVNSAYCVPA